jgi:uncharacterized NAD(P)/FAD-binding protein YdhS
VNQGLSIAIVGLGPKGLFGLESLVDTARRRPSGFLRVDVFEPHVTPGAGPVYDPAQPPYLRMNFSSDQVNMWRAGDDGPRRRPFVQWWTDVYGTPPPTFAPRCDVGRYLVDGLRAIRDAAPPSVEISIIPKRVLSVRPWSQWWEIEVGDAADDAPPVRSYDEVLIASGHQSRWRQSLVEDWNHSARLIPAVYPPEHHLSLRHVPSGSAVAVRGFGLTFIDAVLALTEGRGGRFEHTGRVDRFRYRGCADAPRVIFPVSRTGRPMLAKPDPGRFVNIGPIVQPRSARLFATGATVDLDTEVLPVVADVAADILVRCADHRALSRDTARADMVARLRDMASGEPASPLSALDAIQASVSIGVGLRDIDPLSALAEAWRSLYPTLVAVLSHGGVASADLAGFRRLAAEMERLSFGPPTENGMKLVALVEAGVVDLSAVADGRIQSDGARTWLVTPSEVAAIDVVVDAVLAPPGVPVGGDGMANQMVAEGIVRLVPEGRGIDVLPDATCVAPDGMPTRGLAAIGRVTEDAVIGNDTLNRTLHPQPERWAERVVIRSRQLDGLRAAAPVEP